MKKASLLSMMLAMSLILTSMMLWMNNTSLHITTNLHSINNMINLSMTMNWTSTLFMSTVTLITSAILLYSTTYIPNQKQPQFMIIMLMFVASMLALVTSDNMMMLILGWDGLGVTSFILVMFYQDFNSKASSMITVLTNRLGDIAMIMAVTLSLSSYLTNLNTNKSYSLTIMLLLLTASITKSAQYPFTAWLPAAMAAPTPISALVHSSTLVTAGVYLMLRLNSYYHPNSMSILLMLATLTSLTASVSANWETDMKKIIALSTLSQMAFMMMAISMFMWTLTLFHLITHALFKSTMFMCAGSIIHSSSYQDMRMAKSSLSTTTLNTSLAITSMALMGLPFTAGFYSKDPIIESSMMTNNSTMTSIMVISAGMTASYTIRMAKNSLSQPHKTDNMQFDKTLNNTPYKMSFLSIFTGASLSWMLLPNLTLIMSLTHKLKIITMIASGLIIGNSISNKSLTFNKTPSTMWLMNFLTSTPLMMTTKKGTSSMMLDNTWNELKIPMSMKFITKEMVNKTFINNKMMILMMLALTPLII